MGLLTFEFLPVDNSLYSLCLKVTSTKYEIHVSPFPLTYIKHSILHCLGMRHCHNSTI
jgi:hypothetical protein